MDHAPDSGAVRAVGIVQDEPSFLFFVAHRLGLGDDWLRRFARRTGGVLRRAHDESHRPFSEQVSVTVTPGSITKASAFLRSLILSSAQGSNWYGCFIEQ
jgi:hypothetical protein